MYHSHTLDEWLAMICLAVSGYASLSVPYFVLVDAHRVDFPRLWQGAVYARLDVARAVAAVRHELVPAVVCVRHAAYSGREAARDAAALLLLLTTRPKGALS